KSCLCRLATSLSNGICAGFPGADPDCFLDRRDQHLAVADAARFGRPLNGFDGFVELLVRQDDRDLDLGQQVNDVLGPAVKLGMTFLAAEALGLEDSDALQPYLLKGLLHLVELERFDDGLDLLHSVPPAAGCPLA